MSARSHARRAHSGIFVTAALIAAVAASSGAHAETRRMALLVANHEGGPGLATLRYAERDITRFRDVLVDLSGFRAEDIVMLVDEDADEVKDGIAYLSSEVRATRAKGDDTLLVFYYSGHAENGVLRLGESRLAMGDVKRLLEHSGADVRLAFLDSCGAGAITREKGGTKAPPFLVTVDETLRARGQVIITSSSADEASQESDDIQGSFFTHHLTSGLRGAADRDLNGAVTLDEAYGYAFQKTVAATAMTRSGTQHPTYQYDLTGAGDVVLARTGGALVVIDFPEALSGRFIVVDLDRQLFVAEVEKVAGQRAHVSVPLGRYAVKKRGDTHLLLQQVQAREKGTFVVDENTMEKIAFEDDYAKGTPILEGEGETDGSLGVSFSIGTGGQAVTDTTGFFPPIPMFTLETRLTHVFTRHLMLGLDVGFGSNRTDVQIDELGERYRLQYSQAQLGGSLLLRGDLGPFMFAAGPRTSAFLVVANNVGGDGYDTPDLSVMTLSRLSPGLVGIVGFAVFDWFHVESTVRTNYFLDADSRHMLSGELLLTAWVDL
jgi:hypothetical protein